MDTLTPKQLEWLAGIAKALPRLLERATGNAIVERKVGSRRMPDGRIIEIYITAKSRAPDHPAQTHGMVPPQ
jgi:hypothetical protein